MVEAAPSPERGLTAAALDLADLGPALRTGSAAALVLVALAGRGDLVLVALLVAAAGGGSTGLAVGLAAAGHSLMRWGSIGLPPLAGAQAVLGPAVSVGPAAAAVASGLVAGALVVVPAARRLGPASAAAIGAAAALHAWGPGIETAPQAVQHAGALVAGALVAVAAARWLPARLAASLSLLLAAAALIAQVAA